MSRRDLQLARPVPCRGYVQLGDGHLRQPQCRRRHRVQRRQPLHADRYLPARNVRRRQPARLRRGATAAGWGWNATAAGWGWSATAAGWGWNTAATTGGKHMRSSDRYVRMPAWTSPRGHGLRLKFLRIPPTGSTLAMKRSHFGRHSCGSFFSGEPPVRRRGDRHLRSWPSSMCHRPRPRPRLGASTSSARPSRWT